MKWHEKFVLEENRPANKSVNTISKWVGKMKRIHITLLGR